MKLQTKIYTGIGFVLISLIFIPALITNLLVDKPQDQIDTITVPDYASPTEVTTSRIDFAEGFSLEIVEGWELVVEDQERNVDRYRYERSGEIPVVFTMSFYNELDSFDSVVEARYGAGYIDQREDLEVNGLKAQRLTSAFLDAGNSVDLVIELEEGKYVSLYAIGLPESEAALQIANEVTIMQLSLLQ